jgi:hypothetical protein
MSDMVEAGDRPLLILGTRTFAVEIADLAADIAGVRVAGFVENMEPERCRDTLQGLPVIWVDALAEMAQTHYAVCGRESRAAVCSVTARS